MPGAAGKVRADLLVVHQGLAPSRSRAQALILAGVVLGPDGLRIQKAGELLPEDMPLSLKEQPLKYVSRGGLKLEAALDAFELDVQDKVCLDVGASTGGFTDCMLQRGARRVFAVDVGYNQLVYALREDPRVVCLERTNVRHFKADSLEERPSMVVIDVSFISLRLILEPVLTVVDTPARFVMLVKPQFEVGRGMVGKGGIVRDAARRQAVLDEMTSYCNDLGFSDLRSMDSPIRGAKGNQEFLLTGLVGG